MIRVLVVDDHPSVRENLRYLVNAERDMDCIGVARDAPEAVRTCQELMPDVVILDDEMPGGRGVQVLEWITSELPDTRVVMYTLDAEVCGVARVFFAGRRASAVRKRSRQTISAPRHRSAAAASTPSGAPPVPMTACTSVPAMGTESDAMRSPSSMSLMRAPAARTSLISFSCRGRSRMTIVRSLTSR